MELKSNLAAVIARTKRLQAGIPDALQRTLEPGRWRELLRKEARDTIAANLGVQDGHDNAAITDAFVATLDVTGLTEAAGFAARMQYPRQRGITYQKNLLDGSVDPLTAKTQSDFSRLLGDVYEWVSQEKRWDVERDGTKTAEAVFDKADWFTKEMMLPQSSIITDPASPHVGKSVREVVLPHIADFVNAKAGYDLPEEKIDALLRAVLAAWRNLVRDLFPAKFHTELRAVRGESAST